VFQSHVFIVHKQVISAGQSPSNAHTRLLLTDSFQRRHFGTSWSGI